MRTFHDYEFEALIGEGAMGRVWRARQLAFDGRLVALKRVSYGDRQLAERLRREGRILAQLDHPHIIRVYELIPDGQGIAIAMQYAPGGSLADRLQRQGRLDPQATVAVLAPIAAALGSAHRRGIVHRDVKPSNILFTSDGEPLLSDFGIARVSGDTPLTAPGIAALGTAEYLDPEIVNGAEPDARSDVYALGAVSYETLSGRRPFEAPTPIAVLRLADRGRAASLTGLAPDVGRRLAQVVGQAMARRPERRFADAADLAAALQEALRPTRRSARGVPSTAPSAPEEGVGPRGEEPAPPPPSATPAREAGEAPGAVAPAVRRERTAGRLPHHTAVPEEGAGPGPASPPNPQLDAVPPHGERRVAAPGPGTRAFGPRPAAAPAAPRTRRRWGATRWAAVALVALLMLDALVGTLLVRERDARLDLAEDVELLRAERDQVREQIFDARP